MRGGGVINYLQFWMIVTNTYNRNDELVDKVSYQLSGIYNVNCSNFNDLYTGLFIHLLIHIFHHSRLKNRHNSFNNIIINVYQTIERTCMFVMIIK